MKGSEASEMQAAAESEDAVESPGADALRFLETMPEVYERALPGADGSEALYFAQLSVLRQLIERHFARALKPYGLTHSDYRVLTILRMRDPGYRTTPFDLNQIVQLTSAGMTKTLDRLEAAGRIVRAPNPRDRRSVLVGLTGEGWRFAEEMCRGVAEAYSSALSDRPAKELARDIVGLRSLIERLRRSFAE